jgi:exosortase C (VPDSG-CTERM-specific)
MLVLGFSWPLFALARFAIGSELYSYILLVPLISAALAWRKRDSLLPAGMPARPMAALPLAAGVLLLGADGLAPALGVKLAPDDALALVSLSFVGLLAAIGLFFLGRQTASALAFPLGFLVFLAPMPVALVGGIENFLQHGSAAVAWALFRITGTSVYYHDLIFQLPGISLQVAPECSGIHSSLVLFLTSLLAGHLYLRSMRNRAILALAVIPLALLRNGLRVFTIGELCVQIGPEMIDSYIHRRGGPIFFALSLGPFFLLLFFLVKWDRSRWRAPSPARGT